MSKLRVGVLRGGPSSEYDLSLKTGAAVLSSLPREEYEPVDLFIDRYGQWHLGGLPIYPALAADKVDVFFNCLHGEYGEDGRLQRELALMDKVFTGAEEVAAIASLNKPLTKNLLARAGLLVPPALTLTARLDNREVAREAFTKLLPPWVVKPADRGSGRGFCLARSFAGLVTAIENATQYSDQILIESYIAGKEATVGVIDNFRGQAAYALLPVEACDSNKLICPGTFTESEKAELSALAIKAHELLGLRHYSSVDFIVSPRGIYLLEVDALPVLAPEGRFSQALAAIGAKLGHFVDHIIKLALGSERF